MNWFNSVNVHGLGEYINLLSDQKLKKQLDLHLISILSTEFTEKSISSFLSVNASLDPRLLRAGLQLFNTLRY